MPKIAGYLQKTITFYITCRSEKESPYFLHFLWQQLHEPLLVHTGYANKLLKSKT